MRPRIPIRLTLAVVGLLLTVPAIAEEGEAESKSTEAIEILKKVDAAVKAVDAVRYKATVKPAGVAENFVAPAEGSAMYSGWTGNIPEKFRVHVKSKNRESGEPVDVTGGGNGDMYFLIDHKSKKAYHDMDPNVMGSSGGTLQALSMIEFVHDRPFDDELNADKVELQGTEEVHGVPCYKIHVVYAGGQGQSTWLFSKEDYLPRRRIQHFNIPEQGEGTLERTIMELEVDPELDDALFTLKLPEGYEQIDDFAP